MKSNEILLEVKDVHVGFRIKDDYYDAVDGVSFSLARNEKLAIVGESGCGKSTLATAIVGLHDRLNMGIFIKFAQIEEYTRDEKETSIDDSHY